MAVHASGAIGSLTNGETPSYRHPVIRSKIWGFEPFWKLVNYDVELSSNSSSNSSGGRNNYEDEIYLGSENSPTDKFEQIKPLSSRKAESSKTAERIIPIQRVRTTSLNISPVRTVTVTKGPTRVIPLTVRDEKNLENLSNYNRFLTQREDKFNEDLSSKSRKALAREEKLHHDVSMISKILNPRNIDETNNIKNQSYNYRNFEDSLVNNRKSPTHEGAIVSDLITSTRKSSPRDSDISTLTRKSPTRDSSVSNDVTTSTRKLSPRDSEVLNYSRKTPTSSVTNDLTSSRKSQTRDEPNPNEDFTSTRKSSTNFTDTQSSTRKSPPREGRLYADDLSIHNNRASTYDRQKAPTTSKQIATRQKSLTLPIRIPERETLAASYYLVPKFESLPSKFEDHKPVQQLTSVLKKPGTGK